MEDLEEIVVDASEMDIGVATHRKGKFLTQVSSIPLDGCSCNYSIRKPMYSFKKFAQLLV